MWRRLKACVEAWPECADGEYNPNCCRFPKECSPLGNTESKYLKEEDFEPMPEPSEPALDPASFKLEYTADDDGVWIVCVKCRYQVNLGFEATVWDAVGKAVKANHECVDSESEG